MSIGGGGGMADLSSNNNPDALEMVNDTAVSLDNVLERVSALYLDNRWLPTYKKYREDENRVDNISAS